MRDDRRLAGIWCTLEGAETETPRFAPELVADLPDPAKRYFRHAIRPGTPLAGRLHWRYTGAIKAGAGLPWMSLAAEQIVARGRGFVWRARAGLGPLLATGDDYYLDGDSRIKIALFGLIPVVNAGGPDIARSALARLLIESTALPAALLPGPHVAIGASDDDRFTATVSLHGEVVPLTVVVDDDGRVREVSLPRWGNQTDDGAFRLTPYGVTVEEERDFGGHTIPSRMRGGWWFGTDRYLEVIRLRLDWARHW